MTEIERAVAVQIRAAHGRVKLAEALRSRTNDSDIRLTYARAWLDSPRRNFVDHTLDSDTDSAANGCSVLFLNWLRFQLNHSWTQIAGAAAPTLGETYTKLTGKNDGFKQFESLINQHFPKGQPSGLTSDNPFPI